VFVGDAGQRCRGVSGGCARGKGEIFV